MRALVHADEMAIVGLGRASLASHSRWTNSRALLFPCDSKPHIQVVGANQA